MKHAPGPWRYDKDNLNVYANGMVAQVYGHAHTGERLANAAIIAAAPEMLQMIESLFLDANGNPSFEGSDGDRSYLLSVVRKARGEK